MTVDAMEDKDPKRPLTVAEARATLERLRDSTGAVPRHHPAPKRFINDLHEALIPIATDEMQELYRLGHVVNAPMGYLHDRVVEVLANFDKLLAERQSPG